jgi:BON domain
MKKCTRQISFVIVAVVAAVFAGCHPDNTTAPGNRNGNSNRTAADNANTGGPLSRIDFDKNAEAYKEEAKRLGSKIGSGAEDAWLWMQVRGKLIATDGLRSTSVDVDNNAVTLTGVVQTESQKAQAEQLAKSVSGVTTVTNNITVVVGNANAR